MTFTYDCVGDILYLETRPPYGEQRSAMEPNGAIYRRNPETGDIERIEILAFRRWPVTDLDTLPIEPSLRELLVALSSYARAA